MSSIAPIYFIIVAIAIPSVILAYPEQEDGTDSSLRSYSFLRSSEALSSLREEPSYIFEKMQVRSALIQCLLFQMIDMTTTSLPDFAGLLLKQNKVARPPALADTLLAELHVCMYVCVYVRMCLCVCV